MNILTGFCFFLHNVIAAFTMDYIIAWKIPTFPNFQGTSTNDIEILVNWLVVLQEPIPRGEGSWWIEGAGEGEKSDSLLILCTILWFGSSRTFLILCTNNDLVWIHMQYRHFCRVDNLCVSKEEANNYYYKISFVSSNFLRFAGLWDKEYTKCAKGRDCHFLLIWFFQELKDFSELELLMQQAVNMLRGGRR